MYPTLVIRGTGLYELWKKGLYRNYEPTQLIDLVARILALVPPWVRIYRIQVPATTLPTPACCCFEKSSIDMTQVLRLVQMDAYFKSAPSEQVQVHASIITLLMEKVGFSPVITVQAESLHRPHGCLQLCKVVPIYSHLLHDFGAILPSGCSRARHSGHDM